VYFNEHTKDGPRVGMTRRTKAEIERERSTDSFRWSGAAIVRCDRPDAGCPWTVEGVPASVVHKAQPLTGDRCVVCGQRVRQVPGGHGATWVHADSGAVAAPNPPVKEAS
jgi:hypothetical protein